MIDITCADYYRVGRVDEIMKSGWKNISLLGWDILIIFHNKRFFALDRGGLCNQPQKAFLPEDCGYYSSGAKDKIGKFLLGPDGDLWGKLRYFPVRIENDFVTVGIAR
jgi:hypothetical protein